MTDCGDTGAAGQLRDLVNQAQPGDTIVVPACTIVLAGPAGEDANAGGDLDIGKALTIQGAGMDLTVLDGAASTGSSTTWAPPSRSRTSPSGTATPAPAPGAGS